MPLIVVHGPPGSGKSTVAALLHENLKCPWFEFGWIPEFRHLNPFTEISYEAEEQMTFENLMLVAGNYRKHGFETILLSDLNDQRVIEVSETFGAENVLIVTLQANEQTLCERIRMRDNGNDFRDIDRAVELSRVIAARPLLPNEQRFVADGISPQALSDEIFKAIKYTFPKEMI
jgi:dephospho-CoA kinase